MVIDIIDKLMSYFWLPQPDSSMISGLNYTHDEVPFYLIRDYTFTGYRANLNVFECLSSMFQMHNELVHIWTHLIPALFMWGYAYSYYSRQQECRSINPKWQGEQEIPSSSLATIALQCASMAFVFTVSYFSHTFHPINEAWFVWCWQIDWSAVSLAILGQFATIITFGFYHNLQKQRFWLRVYSLCMGGMLLISNTSLFVMQRIAIKAIVISAAVALPTTGLFVDMCISLPPSDLTVMYNSLRNPIILTLIGITIFGAQLPERWYPGSSDLWGGHHTIHHLWTTGVAFLMERNAIYWAKWRSNSITNSTKKIL